MVRTENDVVRAVYAAKTDPAAADAFVEQYMPFVRSETVKFTRAAIEAGHEDELSVALLAFYEAILHYEQSRGAFFRSVRVDRAYRHVIVHSHLTSISA